VSKLLQRGDAASIQKLENIGDWIMNVSIFRRHIYALAESAAIVGIRPDLIPTFSFQVIREGVPGDASRYTFNVRMPVTTSQTLQVLYHLNLARYTDHPALTSPSREHIGAFLTETAATAASLFNDKDYLNFVAGLCASEDIGLPADSLKRIRQAVRVELLHREGKRNEPTFAKALDRFRSQVLRLPKLYTGTKVEWQSGIKFSYDSAVAIAIAEERWREKDNPDAYLLTAARNIARADAKAGTGAEEWIKAKKKGFSLRSLTSQFSGLDIEHGCDPDGDEILAFDHNEVFRVAGFDADMIAYVYADVAGKTRREMPEYLTDKTSSVWTVRRVDAARKRIETVHKRFNSARKRGDTQLRDAVIRLCLWGVRRETGKGGTVSTAKAIGGISIMTDGAERKPAATHTGPPRTSMGSWGSQTHYKQRFFPSTAWVYAHLFDNGDGEMVDIAVLHEVLSGERVKLFGATPRNANSSRYRLLLFPAGRSYPGTIRAGEMSLLDVSLGRPSLFRKSTAVVFDRANYLNASEVRLAPGADGFPFSPYRPGGLTPYRRAVEVAISSSLTCSELWKASRATAGDYILSSFSAPDKSVEYWDGHDWVSVGRFSGEVPPDVMAQTMCLRNHDTGGRREVDVRIRPRETPAPLQDPPPIPDNRPLWRFGGEIHGPCGGITRFRVELVPSHDRVRAVWSHLRPSCCAKYMDESQPPCKLSRFDCLEGRGTAGFAKHLLFDP